MRSILTALWRWSWLVTLPVAIVFLYWGSETVKKYAAITVRYDPAPGSPLRLKRAGTMEFLHIARQMEQAISFSPRHTQTSRLKSIHLYVPEPNLAQLNANLPHSGFQYVKGQLFDGRRFQKIKFRYRGDFWPHWARHKKSLRVKTKKAELFEGMRRFNLLAPKFREQLQTDLGNRFASLMGLIAPRTELVSVVLNGKRQGVHVLVEQLDESTLRRHQRMPGDLYVGELVAKDRYAGVNSEVFEHAGLWEKVAVYNRLPAESRKPMERLIKLLNAVPSKGVHRELTQLLDVDAWGLFMAYETLTQTRHFDAVHNWRLYFDPSRGKFVPVVWDPLAWQWALHLEPQMDILRTRLHARLLANGDFLRARHRAIEDFFATGSDRIFLKEVDRTVNVMESEVDRDPNLEPTNTELVIERMRVLRDAIARTFVYMQQGYLERDGEVRYVEPGTDGLLSLSFTGRQPVRRIVLDYLEPIREPLSVIVRYWKAGQTVESDVTGATSVRGAKIEIAANLLPNFTPKMPADLPLEHQLETHTAHYEISFQGIKPSNRVLQVTVERGSEELERARRVNDLPRETFGNLWAVVLPQPSRRPLVWQGEVVIDGIREINDDLVLEPGTTIRMEPGAGLILRKRLLARGTVDNPIRFLPASEGQEPWGAVVLLGPTASGSVLRHCVFAEGSGMEYNLVDYSAMFSVHDVQGVEVEQTLFRDSKLTDDMIHAVYSKISLRDCTLLRALSDAIDLDISQGRIERCRILDSGNDAIDLMTTHAVVLDTLLQGNGDKGVSVGEGSQLLAVNNHITKNQFGVQSKDGSVAVLYNVELTDNGCSLDAYRKNWRYGNGGTIFLYKGHVVDNQNPMSADKRSRIDVYDSYCDPLGDAKRVSLHETVDDENPSRAVRTDLWRFPLEEQLLGDVGRADWQRADPIRRGSTIRLEGTTPSERRASTTDPSRVAARRVPNHAGGVVHGKD